MIIQTFVTLCMVHSSLTQKVTQFSNIIMGGGGWVHVVNFGVFIRMHAMYLNVYIMVTYFYVMS